jgi:hypothetical protein
MNKPKSLSAPPKGAVRTDSNIPSETIQVIGRSRTARVPKSISIDMGITDVYTSDSGKSISFKGKGTQTNAGDRIPSNTIGMGIMGDELDMPLIGTGSRRGSRTPVSKNKTRPGLKKTNNRKGKKLSEWDYMTTLKGFRF